MTLYTPLTGRFRPLWTTALLYVVISALLRVVLWGVFGRQAGAGLFELIASLPLGATNDFTTLIYLLFPLSLLLAILPQRQINNRCMQWLALTGVATLLFGIFYLACAEYFFFEEFNARFNRVAVDYLIYPHEVFINIWESYHVVWFLLGCGSISLLLTWWLRRLLIRREIPDEKLRNRLSFVGIHLLALILTIVSVSTDTLSLFNNRVSNEITANGISSIFRALRTNELNYSAYYPTMNNATAFELIRNELGRHGELTAKDQPQNITRNFAARPGLGKLNIVVVVEESFGAQFVGAYGAQQGLTPNFDRLAKEGLLFSNAFANGTRTVHGLGAIVTSLPPIPGEGIIKRPGSWPIANWGEVLQRQGYHTSFLYGGFGLFDNMNPFFGGNGFSLSDRTNIQDVTFSNIWGVCDQDLFNHALGYFDKEAKSNQPFFSVIMSTSNHSPYTFPTGIPGVKAKGGDREAGIRYADFAIGEFIENAAKHSWYQNTIFVIVADHDARVYGRELIPLHHYRIPLLILAPGRLQPSLIATTIGQIDIAPTVMGLLGLGYQAPFYGQDILHSTADNHHPVLVNHDHDVGLLLNDQLAVLGLQHKISCYQVNNSDDSLTAINNDPKLTNLAIAFFQTAFELFKNRRYQLSPEALPRLNALATKDNSATILPAPPTPPRPDHAH